MSYIHAFEAAPEVPEVDGLAQNCAQAGNPFRPGQSARQRRIDGEEADVDIGIVLPMPQEQVGLNRLSANITQAGCNDAHSRGSLARDPPCGAGRVSHPSQSTRKDGHPPSTLLLQKPDIEFHITLAHAIEAEVFLCELPSVPAQLLAKRGVGEKFLDGIGKAGFVAGGNQGSALRLSNSEFPPTL